MKVKSDFQCESAKSFLKGMFNEWSLRFIRISQDFHLDYAAIFEHDVLASARYKKTLSEGMRHIIRIDKE